MPKSQIIKDIVEDSVSLERSLNRLYVIARDVNNKQLSQWAENELNGYKDTDDVPDYRRTKCSFLQYSGINGGYEVTNLPLPTGWIKSDIMDSISQITMYNGIRFIESSASSKNSIARDLTELAGEVHAATDEMVTCTSIHQIIPQSFYQHICAQVKTKMIIALMELEKSYGNLDALGIDISDKQPIQVDTANADLNRAVFHINVPSQEVRKEPWYSKIAWRIVIPITTAIFGAVIAAVVIKQFGL